jgi:hypothetical protein
MYHIPIAHRHHGLTNVDHAATRLPMLAIPVATASTRCVCSIESARILSSDSCKHYRSLASSASITSSCRWLHSCNYWLRGAASYEAGGLTATFRGCCIEAGSFSPIVDDYARLAWHPEKRQVRGPPVHAASPVVRECLAQPLLA